jgi:hypothetical protein
VIEYILQYIIEFCYFVRNIVQTATDWEMVNVKSWFRAIKLAPNSTKMYVVYTRKTNPREIHVHLFTGNVLPPPLPHLFNAHKSMKSSIRSVSREGNTSLFTRPFLYSCDRYDFTLPKMTNESVGYVILL